MYFGAKKRVQTLQNIRGKKFIDFLLLPFSHQLLSFIVLKSQQTLTSTCVYVRTWNSSECTTKFILSVIWFTQAKNEKRKTTNLGFQHNHVLLLLLLIFIPYRYMNVIGSTFIDLLLYSCISNTSFSHHTYKLVYLYSIHLACKSHYSLIALNGCIKLCTIMKLK